MRGALKWSGGFCEPHKAPLFPACCARVFAGQALPPSDMESWQKGAQEICYNVI